MTTNDEPEEISKSERKRRVQALKKLGEKLVDLPATQLAQIPLDPFLAAAIQEARKLTAHGAKRRQLQYIGRLMRDADPEPILAAMDKLELKSGQSKAILHQIERWRDRLIKEDDEALQAFLSRFSHADRQHLRQMVRNAKKSMKGADTELFRYLREIIDIT